MASNVYQALGGDGFNFFIILYVGIAVAAIGGRASTRPLPTSTQPEPFLSLKSTETTPRVPKTEPKKALLMLTSSRKADECTPLIGGCIACCACGCCGDSPRLGFVQ